jgi:hypothetical protein
MTYKGKCASEAERRKTLSYLNQLRTEGIDIGEGPEILEAEEEKCSLMVTQGSGVGVARDFSPMNVGIAAPIRIVCRRRTILEDCWIEAFWDDYTIELACLSAKRGRNHFGLVTYSCSEVLNDHFIKPFPMNRGAVLDGMILAYSCLPIPEELRGKTASVRVTVVDTLGDSFSGDISLFVERPFPVPAQNAAWPAGRGRYREANNGRNESVLSLSNILPAAQVLGGGRGLRD